MCMLHFLLGLNFSLLISLVKQFWNLEIFTIKYCGKRTKTTINNYLMSILHSGNVDLELWNSASCVGKRTLGFSQMQMQGRLISILHIQEFPLESAEIWDLNSLGFFS